MSDSLIFLDNDYEISVSSAAGIWVAHDSRSPSLTRDYMGHEVVSLLTILIHIWYLETPSLK